MFIIATNDRESHAYAAVEVAGTAPSAREKFIEAWKALYDTSTVILVHVAEDLSLTTLFYADEDGQDENFEIHTAALEALDVALAPYTTA